jgi:hypothetical protein
MWSGCNFSQSLWHSSRFLLWSLYIHNANTRPLLWAHRFLSLSYGGVFGDQTWVLMGYWLGNSDHLLLTCPSCTGLTCWSHPHE